MSNIITLGAGDLWVKATTATNPATVRIATCKKITVGMTKASIELTGAYEFPLDVAGGKAECKGKITIAGFETGIVGTLFSGTTTATGYTCMVVDEATTLAGTTYQVVNHSAAIVDYGVLYAPNTSGVRVPFTRVTTPSAAGQYSVAEASGTYTFYSADNTASIQVSYTYAVAGSGSTLDIKSALIGSNPAYVLCGWTTYSGQKIGYRFPTVRLTGLSFDFDTEKHATPEYDYAAFALPGASVMTMWFGQ